MSRPRIAPKHSFQNIQAAMDWSKSQPGTTADDLVPPGWLMDICRKCARAHLWMDSDVMADDYDVICDSCGQEMRRLVATCEKCKSRLFFRGIRADSICLKCGSAVKAPPGILSYVWKGFLALFIFSKVVQMCSLTSQPDTRTIAPNPDPVTTKQLESIRKELTPAEFEVVTAAISGTHNTKLSVTGSKELASLGMKLNRLAVVHARNKEWDFLEAALLISLKIISPNGPGGVQPIKPTNDDLYLQQARFDAHHGLYLVSKMRGDARNTKLHAIAALKEYGEAERIRTKLTADIPPSMRSKFTALTQVSEPEVISTLAKDAND